MENKKGIIALLITVFIWASSFATIKVGLQEIEPLTLAFVRGFLASIFLLAIIIIKKENKKFIKSITTDWKYFSLLGIVGITLFNTFQNIGVKYTSSALAGILINSNPVFILIFSGLFLDEVITGNKVIGIITGFVGMIVIVFMGQNISEIIKSQIFLGNVLVIGSALSWALYSIMNKNIFNKYSPLHLTTIAYIVGSILLFLIAFLFEDVSGLFLFSIRSWVIVLYLGIVASAITFFLWNYALSKMDVSKASVFLFLGPVIVIIIGWLFMGEVITIHTIIGSVLVLFGVYLTERQ